MTLRTFLEKMEDPRKDALLAIYDQYADLFHYALGSTHNHQAWRGGYADHILECLRINSVTYDALEQIRSLPFTKDSAAICLFLHDIEKPFRYGPEDHPVANQWHRQAQDLAARTFPDHDRDQANWRAWEVVKQNILEDWREAFDINLTEPEMNALHYTHGEGDAHRKDARVAGPLAAHVHHCDNTSARIWFDKGEGLSKKPRRDNEDLGDVYCLIRDGSEHWYLCPASKREEGNTAMALIERFWENPKGEAPDIPDYILAIDGPHKLTFMDPKNV